MDLLRLATAGSVDDGKSTLVGRLLYDTKSVLADQLAAVEAASTARGATEVDLALLTDGLRSEREQGITIDVAYRYFATPRRKFILADTPGHVQYTRNMVTGASTAELVVLLVDARHGVTDQTRRHTVVSALLGVRHLVLAVNKMDLVDFDQDVFDAVNKDFTTYAAGLGIADAATVPVSALRGDNIVDRGDDMPWYDGPTLLEVLESVPIGVDPADEPFRLPVQTVIRPRTAEHPDYRGYAGQVASGVMRINDVVVIQPSGLTSTVTAIDGPRGPLDEAFEGQSISVQLADDIDVARGDLIVHPRQETDVVRELTATVSWLSEKPLRSGDRVLVKHLTRTVKAVVDQVVERIDIDNLDRVPADALELNDIGTITVRTAEPLTVEVYSEHRHTGGFLVVDAADGLTLGAGMVGDPLTDAVARSRRAS
jgi:sulfate adenylyltransferase subunit 1